MPRTDGPGPPATTLADKVAFLRRPASHGDAAAAVTVRETHKSFVFLVGDRALKLKKPLPGDRFDLCTLEGRAANVREEIRLNRRLARDVYLGARALGRRADGTLSLGGEGEIVDWLVEMRRMPERRTLDALIRSHRLAVRDIDRICACLAAFYRDCPPAAVAPDAVIARFESEHRHTAAILTDRRFALDHIGVAAALARFDGAFERARPMLRARLEGGRFVEGHGDLRPEHVFLTDPVAIIDCLEFDPLLRCVDPFDEIAFLGLECAQFGADWVFPALRACLSRALGDPAPGPLTAFYWRYRALLRARLAILHLSDPDIRTPGKWRPLAGRYVALSDEAEVRTRLPAGR